MLWPTASGGQSRIATNSTATPSGSTLSLSLTTWTPRNWVVDFGSLKSLKAKLDEWFDHTCLVALDDPEYKLFQMLHDKHLIKMVAVDRTGCEGLAEWLYSYVDEIWMPENGYADRCRIVKVEVRETPSNSASYVRTGYV